MEMKLEEIKKGTVRIILFGNDTFNNKKEIKELGFTFGYNVINENGESNQKLWNIVVENEQVGIMYKKVIDNFNITKIDRFGKILNKKGAK